MRSAVLTFTSSILALSALSAAPNPPNLRLPDTIAPISYRASLVLDPAKPAFSGEISIHVDIKQPTEVIWLNAVQLKLQKATLTAGDKTAGDKTIDAQVIPGGVNFIGLQFPSPVAPGKAEIAIKYTGEVRQKDSSGVFHMLDNGNDYLYTQFESIDARDVFPCFDEPSFKVPWQLTLDVPSTDSAVSNTSPSNEETRGDRKVITFGKTKPLPSYLVAFAVGPFDFVPAGKAGKAGIPVRIVTPKGHADEAKYAAEVTPTIINRLEDYFGIPFPYDKSDQVAIPVTFGFGAMENAGMVTYAQTIILAKAASDTEARRRAYASTAAHELAHQWFGDYVTTAWWNDIWLNEAFATWMEQKIIREWKPEWKTSIEDVESKLYSERQDSLVAARKIRQEIKSNDDISNAFDGITYQKGASVIGMFESYVGSEEFRKGVQSYLKHYAFKNATAPEFLDAISTSSRKNITAAFTTFLNQAGIPLLDVSLKCDGSAASLQVQQQRYLPLGSEGSTQQVWQVPVCVRYGSGDTGQTSCQLISAAKAEMKLKGSGCPAWVVANDKARGYYRVSYSPELMSSLTQGDVQKRLTAPEKVDLMGNAEALVNAGKLPLDSSLELVNTFHADPALQVIGSALELALQPGDHLVPADLQQNYQRFLQKNFQNLAHEFGWKPAPGESDQRTLLRPQLLYAMATTGGDTELAKEAKELTQKWFDNKNAIAPSMTAPVLGTAAYYGDNALEQKLIQQLSATKDRLERGRIIYAMSKFRDPAALKTGMQAVLSGKVPFIEGGRLLFAGQTQTSTRTLGFEFMKQHFDELAANRPSGGGFDAGAQFPYVGASFCEADKRSALQSFFQPRVEKFTGAPRVLSQVLESIDVCIAEKQAQEPGLIAFLKNY